MSGWLLATLVLDRPEGVMGGRGDGMVAEEGLYGGLGIRPKKSACTKWLQGLMIFRWHVERCPPNRRTAGALRIKNP